MSSLATSSATHGPRLTITLSMARVYDVSIVLDQEPDSSDVALLFLKLQEHGITCVDLGAGEPTGRQHEFRFAIYAELGQVVASRFVAESVQSLFHTDLVALNERR